MAKEIYRTKNYEENYSTFSGEIQIEDFNTYSPNKKRISNQIEAINFPETIKKKQVKKDKEEKYKNMTLEELKEMRIISNTNGRPDSNMTDERWQKEFNVRKLFITPNDKKHKRMGGKFSRESGTWNEEKDGEYLGMTNYQEYCSYINDVLKNIRAGQIDYCYFIYHIMDLLKFHYDDLRTKYCDGYWEVWLERQDKGCRD